MRMTKWQMVVSFMVLVLTMALFSCGGGEKAPAAKTAQKPAPAAKKTLAKGDPVKGKDAYLQSCSACHGPDAKGITGLGKDLTTSKFAIDLSDEGFLDYVNKGRAVDDPLNTTGIPMPPKGGNPALTDAQIMDIIAYIRTLEKK